MILLIIDRIPGGMRTVIGRVVAMVLGLGLAACGDDDDTESGDTDTESGVTDTENAGATIVAADIAFDPTELASRPARTITLRTEDDVEHSFIDRRS